MGTWDNSLMKLCKRKPMVCLRFVGDVFGLFVGGWEELKDFENVANSIHLWIKVEMQTSKPSINFLDVCITKNGHRLNTTIFCKPTDRHMYLYEKSNHPNTTKNAIPFGLGIRAKRICSTQEEYNNNRQRGGRRNDK